MTVLLADVRDSLALASDNKPASGLHSLIAQDASAALEPRFGRILGPAKNAWQVKKP
jgi:hypothetical protein